MDRSSLASYPEEFLRRGSETAYVQRNGYRTVRWSYQRVAETAFQVARELEARGIGRADRVMLWGPNSAEWVAAFFGCLLLGAVIVPMDDASSPEFAQRVYRQVSAKLMMCSRDHARELTPALLLDEMVGSISRHSSSPYTPVNLNKDDSLEIVFTSGTTAEPTGVVITHGNVLANLAPLESEIARYLKYERLVHPIRFLNLLPLSHVFGQFLGIFLPQIMGGTVVFQDAVKPAEIVSTIRRERVSVLVVVPRILESLKERVERDLDTLGRLDEFHKRFQSAAGKHFLHRWWIFRPIHREFGWKFWAFISGGAALDAETEEFWARLGYATIQGYGLTETTSLISLNHPFRLSKGSIGKVLAGREVKLANDGEILVRGGGVAAGRWGAQLQPIATQDGWYHTGDIGEMDSAGNLFFKGRKKEVIVTPAGMNVYPEDLEAALRKQPEVKDAVVVSLARGGNAEPCAVLTLQGRANAEEAVKRANQSLAEYQRINAWLVWPEPDFPRTSTQKPRRGEIQRAVQVHHADSTTTPLPGDGLSGMISQVTGRAPRQLPPEASLESDLNLSSLDRVALLSALEERYHLDLSESRFSSLNTVADLERMMRGQPLARTEFTYPHWTLQWPVSWIRLVSNYLLLRPAVLLLGWPKVEGRANLRDIRGPVLVICNHIGDVDVGFVLAALPHCLGNRLATATGGEALQMLHSPPQNRNFFQRAYGRLRWALGVSLLNLFPLPREAGFRQSFAFAGEAVDRGYNLLVFPEGRHTEDGKLRPFRPGIGLLAVNLGIPIIPMRIDGLFELKRAGKKFASPGQIRIVIGAPVKVPPDANPETVASELHRVIEGL